MITNSPRAETGGLLVLYDGICGLCNRAVQFILKRDLEDRFRFAPLQSQLARKILARHNFAQDQLDTMCLVINPDEPGELLLSRSDAAVAIGKQLGGFWRILSATAQLLPPFVLDSLYNSVARRRYRFFGKHETCPLPAPEQRAKFLN